MESEFECESPQRIRHEAVIDVDGSAWDKQAEAIMERRTIALRGAGSNNGIEKSTADKLLNGVIIPLIKSKLERESIALVFDGDSDRLDKPDIGYIMGRLRDAFSNLSREQVVFLAAPTKSLYYPDIPGGNLGNAYGLEYETYVFDDGKFPGEHNRFTQSEMLVNAIGYEQWYVGALGPISFEQLADYNSKVKPGKKQKVLFFRAPVNPELEQGIQAKFSKAKSDGDSSKISKFQEILLQRENKYGFC